VGDLGALVTAALPVVGVIIGAAFQYWFTRTQERQKQTEVLRDQAYADYLRRVAQLGAAFRAGRQQPEEPTWRVIEAKARIAIYGTTRVGEALARLHRSCAVISGDGEELFLELFRPAYNTQFAVDTEAQIVVGVDLDNRGTDQGQLVPMLEQLAARYGRRPAESLVDGGFVALDQIEKAAAEGTTVYAPVAKPKDSHRDPYTPLPSDTPAVAQWRERMGSEEAKQVYKLRAATCECVNAISRNRGLQQFRVRGRQKARAVALWFAIAHNMMRSRSLVAAVAPAAA
jgi:hypothetical protein